MLRRIGPVHEKKYEAGTREKTHFFLHSTSDRQQNLPFRYNAIVVCHRTKYGGNLDTKKSCEPKIPRGHKSIKILGQGQVEKGQKSAFECAVISVAVDEINPRYFFLCSWEENLQPFAVHICRTDDEGLEILGDIAQ